MCPHTYFVIGVVLGTRKAEMTQAQDAAAAETEEEVINHAWFGLSMDSFISPILKGWVMLVRKCSSGRTPLPTDVQVLSPSYTAIRGQGHPQEKDQRFLGHPLSLAAKLGTGHLFTGYLWIPGQK